MSLPKPSLAGQLRPWKKKYLQLALALIASISLPSSFSMAVASQRRIALGVLGCELLQSAPVRAQMSFKKEMMMQTENPPLPASYRKLVLDIAKIGRQALVKTLKANRQGDSSAMAEVAGDQKILLELVARYERDYLSDNSPLKGTNAMPLPDHPVTMAMTDVIRQLKSGGNSEDMTSFRLDLSRRLTGIQRLATNAGEQAN
eukprot:TRINITY_DN57880_c0_g1_i1.p1 TRINITY_DN57880_c0_g1~~TRINITY_DN57880_c0_g1_i1.p1  ORF type:complete len:202 (-),score=28.31 TRINITY_DN57880_c0_g1_i1:543-1148(-)